MKEFKCEDWRTCHNCAHKTVCAGPLVKNEICEHHVHDFSGENYADIYEILEYVCSWLKTQYPNDAFLLIDRNSAKLLINKSNFYTKEITDFSLGEAFQKMQEEMMK